MIRLLAYHWKALKFEAWNARCRERGETFAIVTPPPTRERLRRTWKFAQMDWREGIALRIAPWLNEGREE